MKLPIISLKELPDALTKLGIVNKKAASVMDFDQLDGSSLSQKQLSQFKFAPKIEAVILEGSDDIWFRLKGNLWSSVFVLLPGDLVLLIAEYVVGADMIKIASCAGGANKGESMADCAIREALEETGIVLESVIPLSKAGLPISTRQSQEKMFPFLGIPKLDESGKPIFKEICRDDGEDMAAFLMPLADYWEFLDSEHYDNAAAPRELFYAAMRQLGRLALN